MNKPPPQRAQSPGRTNLASCVVATIFLIFIAMIILIVFFTLFKPKDPKISVNAVQLPNFSVTNGTVSFTFSQYLSFQNPNRDSFSHYDSSLQLIYSGSQVGFTFIPAAKINSGETQHTSATIHIDSFSLSSQFEAFPAEFSDGVENNGGFRLGPMFEMQSSMKLAGKVRVLQVFTHHVEVKAVCRVSVSVSDGSVLGFHC